MLLKDALGDLTGKRAVVIGRSNLVGKPIAQLLLAGRLHRDHRPFAHAPTCRPSAARPTSWSPPSAGRRWSSGDWIKPGAAVIDVGINRVPVRDPEAAAAGKTRLVGDVDFDEADAGRRLRSRRCPAASAR